MQLLINVYRGIRDNKILVFLFASLILLLISVFINFYSFKVFDPDGYYHIRHAWLYRMNGIFDTSFPWTQFSMVRELGGDLWYGFHLLLIPFTYFKDLIMGIKAASTVITWIALLLYFFAMYRLGIRLPLFWAAFLPFSSFYLLARFTVTRPHPISLGLNILLFSFLVQGGFWPVFITSFFLSFIHFNLAWIPILALLIISIGRKINNQSLEINKALALFGGIILGMLLKPHPIATLKLNYIQLVDITLVKMKGVNLDFGNELMALQLSNFSPYLLPFVAVMTLFFIWLVYKKHLTETPLSTKIAMWTLLLLTMFFLGLVLFAAGRAMDFFLSYFIMFAAYNVTFYINYLQNKYKNGGFSEEFPRAELLRGGAVVTIILFILISNFSAKKDYQDYQEWLPGPYRSEMSSAWLERNTKQGEIVFHLGWDNFPELFFWNQHNYYINGMDPIFMYKYDEKLHWEFHFLSVDRGGEDTCSYRKCTKEQAVKTYDVLVDHFKASYILIRPDSQPNVFAYLNSSPDKFERVFVNRPDVIFKIKPRPKK